MICALLLCALLVSVFAPCVYADVQSGLVGTVVGNSLIARNWPGTDQTEMHRYQKGDTFLLDDTSVVQKDGYTWYKTEDGWWVPHTGYLQITSGSTAYTDNIVCYDGEGMKVWEHKCTSTNPNFMYHLELFDDHYMVSCDCGWWYRRNVVTHYNSNVDGSMEALSFIGLDTNNDERVDLLPGQKKDLPNRSASSLRSYEILEFYDQANRVTPTVTLTFATADNEVIAKYDFLFHVFVHVEPYGIVMEGMDGSKKIHYVDGDFLLLDRVAETYLGDNVRKYETLKQYNGLHAVLPAQFCMEFVFTLEAPGNGDFAPLEWVVHITRSIVDFISELFDFFGLGFIFTDENSPFKFLMGG